MSSTANSANPQWGGRFTAAPADIMRRINASIGFDQALWRQDIAGSRAHAAMLAHVGIISAQDAADIQAGLANIAADIEAGSFSFTVGGKLTVAGGESGGQYTGTYTATVAYN